MDGEEGPSTQPTWGARNGRSGLEAAALGPRLTPPSLALGSARRRPRGGRRGARGRSGGGGQARACPRHRSARAPGRRCLPSGCGAQRPARSRSKGRCQVAGPASCLHGPGARRGGRRRPGSRPPGQRRRLLRAPAGAGPPASLPCAPVFFVVAGSPPPDPAAGAALQRHIIKPGLAGNVAGSQQEDVRSGVPAGERSDPVGRPALLRLGSDGERANSTERWTALEIQLRPPAKPGPRRQARRGHRTGTRGPDSSAGGTGGGRREQTRGPRVLPNITNCKKVREGLGGETGVSRPSTPTSANYAARTQDVSLDLPFALGFCPPVGVCRPSLPHIHKLFRRRANSLRPPPHLHL